MVRRSSSALKSCPGDKAEPGNRSLRLKNLTRGIYVSALLAMLARHCSGGEGDSAKRNCQNQSLSDKLCIVPSDFLFEVQAWRFGWWSQ